MFRVILLDDPIEMNVDEVLARRRSPVAQQPGLDVLELERFGQEGVVVEIDLADRQVVGRPPVGIHLAEQLAIECCVQVGLPQTDWRRGQSMVQRGRGSGQAGGRRRGRSSIPRRCG